jgi:hypothetical protein
MSVDPWEDSGLIHRDASAKASEIGWFIIIPSHQGGILHWMSGGQQWNGSDEMHDQNCGAV